MVKNIIDKHPIWCMLSSAVVISFSGILVKLSQTAPTTSAFYRVLFGAIFLLAACAVRKEFVFKDMKTNSLAILCGLLFALDLFFWHLSIQFTGPGLATILGNFQVFILSLTGVLIFKEKLTLQFIMAVPLAVLGLFFIIGIDIDVLTREYIFGVIFGLVTAVFYSAFLLLVRKLHGRASAYSLFYILMVISFSCALFLGLEMWVVSDPFAISSVQSLLSLVVLGVMVQAVAWVVISNAMPNVRASHAGLILLLQPALSFVWDVLIFSRPTGMIGWIGVITVLMAIYLGMAGQNRSA